MPSLMHPPTGSSNSLDQPPPPPPSGPLPNPTHPSHQQQRSCLREQQVIRLRQEMSHPAGVRLTLRRRDCQNSLALVELFGCLWVAGWKQREYPVLYNAFHIGDQIATVAGGPVRTASDFHKAVKPPKEGGSSNASALYVEIVVRRVPFGQVFHLKREVEGQPLGIVTQAGTSDVGNCFTRKHQ